MLNVCWNRDGKFQRCSAALPGRLRESNAPALVFRERSTSKWLMVNLCDNSKTHSQNCKKKKMWVSIVYLLKEKKILTKT